MPRLRHIAPLGLVRELDGVEAIYLTTKFHYRSLTVNPGIAEFCRQRLKEFEIVHIYGLYDILVQRWRRIADGS